MPFIALSLPALPPTWWSNWKVLSADLRSPPIKPRSASITPAKTDQMQDLLHEMEMGNIDILIGTQIITKGYHFPSFQLVSFPLT